MRTLLIAAVVALAMSVGVPGQAATVIFRLYAGLFSHSPYTYRVTAQVVGADSFGLAAYGVQLIGSPSVPTGSILTVNNTTLRGTDVETTSPGSDPGPAGFTLLRSADDNSAATGTNAISITGWQDITDPSAHLIRGFGMEASNAAAKGLVGSFPEGNPWGNAGIFDFRAHPVVDPGEFEIARGTLSTNSPPGGEGVYGIDFLHVPTAGTGASVFTSPDGIAIAPATIVRIKVFVPEPATVGMTSTGFLALAAFRRRIRALPLSPCAFVRRR
jgi:hypothetical protein